jgi:magnesium-transporting ATPase (P-type)
LTEVTEKLTELPLGQMLAELDSSAQGLTAVEALQRLQHYGANEIAERHRNPVLVFLGYFWAPIPWMIEAALVLSLAAEHWTDAVIIAVLLVMNGVVAFAEEHQAANAIAALKQRLASSARVLRDGTWVTVAVRDLVPGDVVRIRLGDVVPADLRVLADVTLEVDQSALTGRTTREAAEIARMREPGNRWRFRAGRARCCIRARCWCAVKPTRWSTPPGRHRLWARPRRWWRPRARSAISSARCCGSATT